MPSHQAYWPEPDHVASALLGHRAPIIGFELAPSGRVHAGILRTLLYASAVQVRLLARDARAEILIRINDLVAARDGTCGPHPLGRPLITGTYGGPERDPVGRLREDLAFCKSAFSVPLDRIVLASQCYGDPAFRSLIRQSLEHAPAIASVLACQRRRDTPLFTPLCAGCRHLYSVDISSEDASAGVYLCRRCGKEGRYDVSTSEGLVTFKLESALIWRHLNIAAELHGQDHIEAYEVAALVSEILFNSRPVAGRVNSTFNSAGEKVSKSRRNFLPVAEMTADQRRALLAQIARTPWRQPLKLPASLSASETAPMEDRGGGN